MLHDSQLMRQTYVPVLAQLLQVASACSPGDPSLSLLHIVNTVQNTHATPKSQHNKLCAPTQPVRFGAHNGEAPSTHLTQQTKLLKDYQKFRQATKFCLQTPKKYPVIIMTDLALARKTSTQCYQTHNPKSCCPLKLTRTSKSLIANDMQM